MLAFKRLPWRSVRAPAVMPKPDLVALTGGYRRIPVLQIDNHVYCDTWLIARVLEAQAPTPTLYPTPIAQSIAEWADSALFDATIHVAMRPTRLDDLVRWLTPDEMNKFVDDRRAMGEGARRVPPPGKVAKAQLAIYLARLDEALAGSRFVAGDVASIADFSAYHCAWFVTCLAPEVTAPYVNLRAWMARIAALEDAAVTPMSAEEALQVCRDASPQWQASGAFVDPSGLSQEQRVVVRPLDYGRDPVEGALVASSVDRVTLRREDPRAGVVFVHFPRLGYEIQPVR